MPTVEEIIYRGTKSKIIMGALHQRIHFKSDRFGHPSSVVLVL